MAAMERAKRSQRLAGAGRGQSRCGSSAHLDDVPCDDCGTSAAPTVPDRSIDRPPVRVFAVTSGKGGVGKTTVAVNLALATASLGRSVTVFDADLALANVDLLLGLKPKFNLADVVNGRCEMEDIVLKGPGGIRVIPGTSGSRGMTDLSMAQYAGLMHACSTLEDASDVFLIDTATGLSEGVVRLCAASQEVIVVVRNEPTSISDAYALIQVLREEHGLSRFRILANMARNAYEGIVCLHKLARMSERSMDVVLDLIGTIPYDSRFSGLAHAGRALVDALPDSQPARAFTNIARRSEEWRAPAAPTGKLEFFLERLIGSPSAGL